MTVRNIFIIIGLIVFIIFALPVAVNILNPGNIAGMLIGIIITAAAAFSKSLFRFVSGLWTHTAGKAVIIILSAIIAFSVIYALTLTAFIISARMDKPENPAAVIVLGCKVKGERPSRMLRMRLDAAVKYLDENKDVVCIVSGGKGEDEMISEAQAMENYLIEKGIDPKRVIKEDKSTNTYENLKNSIAVSDLHLDSGQEIAIVTDGFHQYRAGYIAKSMGFNAAAVNPKTDIHSVMLAPTYCVREWMAITNEYIKSL